MSVAPAKKPRQFLPLSRPQAAFVDSQAPYRGFVGGRGAGKSHVGAYDLIRRARRGRLYMGVAPTYPVLRDATVLSFLSVAARLGVGVRLVRHEMRAVLPDRGVEVLFRSADDPDLLRGPNLSGCWIDEASLTAPETYDVMIASLREGGERGWLSATFTPKGKAHWTYEVFATGRPDTALFHSTTRDNVFLPPEFEETVRRQYPSQVAEQELDGRFVDFAGTWFDRGHVAGWLPTMPHGANAVRYWDTAASTGEASCYTAGVLIGRLTDGRFAVLDVVRGKWLPADRDAAIVATARADKNLPGVRVSAVWVEQEPGGSGLADAQALVAKLAGFNARAWKETGDKDVRLRPFAAQWQARNVLVAEGPWNKAYLDELGTIPGGRVRDQCDATAGAFNRLTAGGEPGPPQTAPAGSTVTEQLPDWTFR